MNKIILADQFNFTLNFENFFDKNLYEYCKKVGFNARIWSRRFMAAIPEVARRRLYKKYGYCSIHEFASKMGSISHDNVDEVLRVNEKFRELPKMKALIGEIGLSKLKVVACIVTKDTDSFWAEKVKNLTKSSLEIYVKEIKIKDTQGRIVAKFPGEAGVEGAEIPQLQEQIDMFDSEKSISQNDNGTRVENIQNHDKKTFTIQIDDETEFELRKFKIQLEKEKKEPIDWNSALKEMAKRVMVGPIQTTGQNSQKPVKSETDSDPSQPTAVSRYIPANIKYNLEQKYHGHCAYKNCSKPAEHIHHADGFAITKNHENLIPLCRNHHDLIHQTSMINSVFNKFK